MCVIFFFFKQKTAYEMRISDWSSDVCSSDLRRARSVGEADRAGRGIGIARRPIETVAANRIVQDREPAVDQRAALALGQRRFEHLRDGDRAQPPARLRSQAYLVEFPRERAGGQPVGLEADSWASPRGPGRT